jgi:hypothetical protein
MWTLAGEWLMRRSLALLACVLLLGITTGARADGLFGLSASSSTTTINSSGSSLIGLVNRLTNTSDQFSPLANQNFSASLNYAGIPSAIEFQQSFNSSGNRIITLKVPSVGVKQTFSSADGSLSSQIEHYLKRDGLAKLSAFQSVVGRSSPAGVVDGNPLAATALLEDAGYQEFALHPTPFDFNGKQFSTDGGRTVSRYWVDGGVLDAGGISGQYVNLTLATEFNFNDFIGLSFTSPLRFQTLKSADIFMGGEVVGLPLHILPAVGGPISWQVTPEVQGGAVGSQDLVSGGLLYGAQINSSLSLNLAGFIVTLADNAGYDHGENLDISGYHFDTQVNDWIFKNGLEISKSFGNFFIDASGSWTDFARSAYVSGYFTPEIGVGFKFGRRDNCGFRLGYTGNFGDNYNTNGGDILLYFKS